MATFQKPAPHGNTQWVRNLRAAGEGELRRIAPDQPVFRIEPV
jgi:hypothetical protein